MFLLLCFCLYDHFPAISPWCKRWGRSCELHLQGHVQPLDPGSSSAQTPHGHSNNVPRRLLHLCTPAVHLCQCGAYGQEGGGEIGKHREVRHYCPSLIIPRDLPWITWSNYIMKYVQVCGSIPGSLYVLCSVDIAQLAQAEAIPSRWIHVAIHRHYRTCRWHLECLANLDIHLKVRNGAPVFWSWSKPTSGYTSNGLHWLF